MTANTTKDTAANNTLKHLIVRISPLTHHPVIFDALSKRDGQLKAIVNNVEKTVGLDFYMASLPMEDDAAKQVVQAYAKHAHLPLESLIVRHRLPKTISPAPRKYARRTNDSNLVLVAKDKPAQEPGEQTLEQRVQAFHDSETRKAEARKANEKGGKDSVADNTPAAKDNNAAAPVERTKRAYNRQSKDVRSKRSQAAFLRYQQELAKTVAEHMPEAGPVVPGPGVSQETVDEATLAFALKLAKLLKGVM